MDIQATTTPAVSGSSTSTGTAQGTGKTNGGKSPFSNLLQTIGGQSADSDNKQTDPMTAVLALLAGGLNPFALQQMPTVMTADGEKAATPVVNVMLGTRSLDVQLAGLPLQSGDLAALLQQFGASSKLLGVLQEHPEQSSAQVLSAHPELFSDVGQALTNLVQQAAQNPQLLLAQPKAAVLMEGIFAQLLQSEGAEDRATNATPQSASNAPAVKQPQFGKLQAATITSLNLQVQVASEPTQTTAASAGAANAQTLQATVLTAAMLSADHPIQEQAKSGDSLDATHLLSNPLAGGQTPLQSVNAERLAKMQPVVTMHADQFHNQFAEMVVKRAALLEAPGRHEFRIVLQPQGLGEIEVRVQAIGNQISMQFSADSAATKGLLDSNLSSLKSQLQAQGIQFDRIDVSSSNTNNSTNQNGNGSLNSGLPQDRQSGQSFQGQSGNQSNRKQNTDRFSIDSVDAVEIAAAPEEQEVPEEASLDVTA
ncbi:flagellar hook-length control protein FliK [Tumebacillus sp. ITR2]|uniref:Flagellar hook-length control protein FliK n=1 Tax=Tumebacillus amylolyticus TaxID=2801339 RepID=A0ABS1JF43_9BACL|nr:flagellar hook-length control protein FliK [Tumebacillus amylolyticus]MBL0388914.1 flagellar hook-length control protein FliK [Tumebacillus amylolyticus]